MTRRFTAARGIAAAAAVVLGLTVSGCSAPSDDSIAASLEAHVAKELPDVNGAHVSLSYDGPQRAILLILYVKTDDASVVAKDVSIGMRQMWKDAPFTPASVSVGAVKKTKPARPTNYEATSIDPAAIARALSLPARDVSDTWVHVAGPELANRYGARSTP